MGQSLLRLGLAAGLASSLLFQGASEARATPAVHIPASASWSSVNASDGRTYEWKSQPTTARMVYLSYPAEMESDQKLFCLYAGFRHWVVSPSGRTIIEARLSLVQAMYLTHLTDEKDGSTPLFKFSSVVWLRKQYQKAITGQAAVNWYKQEYHYPADFTPEPTTCNKRTR